ncbi:MAG: helix-turn-helix domain-containing protein [Caulobacteraceae bacterium]
MTGDGRLPNPVDKHVGEKIRLKRKAHSVSQERLAEALGLTFQQVQKYERGSNRVSASKLYEIARYFSVPVSTFFEGFNDARGAAAGGVAENEGNPFIHDYARTPEGSELLEIYMKLPVRVRRRLLDLARAMADKDE